MNSGTWRVLGPFPEREGVLAVDEAAVPARADQQALEAERREAALAFGDVVRVERIERAEAHRLLGARSTSAAIWSLTACTMSSAGAVEIAVQVSAGNGCSR